MTKVDNGDFKDSTKCWICDNDYIDNDVKVSDYCHITGTWDCHINIKLNDKILVIFHNLRKYVCHLFIQELGKFNLKINVILKDTEKYMSSTVYKMVEIREKSALQFIASDWS